MQKYYSKSIVVTLLFLQGFFTIAQDSTNTFSYSKKIASRFEFLEYKYDIGAYEEVIKVSGKYIKQAEQQPINVQTVFYVYQAKAHYALLNIDKAKSIAEAAEKRASQSKSKEELILSTLSIVDYYESIGDIKRADQIQSSLDSAVNGSIKVKSIAREYNWYKASITYKKGFYKDALDLLFAQSNEFSENAATDDSKLYDDLTQEVNYRKRRTAQMYDLIAKSYIGRGMFVQADSMIVIYTNWSKKQLSSNTFISVNLNNLRAEISYLKNKYGNASDYYISAYATPGIQERENRKIGYMYHAIENFYRSGSTIQSQSYLRRLQMLAFQSVGKNENVQIAYELAESFRLYTEANVKSSEKRLVALLEKYKNLPDNNEFKFKAFLLLSELYEKTGNVEKLLLNEAKIAAINEQYYGSKSIMYHVSMLNLALFEIKFGKNFSMASKIMNESYDNVVSKQIHSGSFENIKYLNAFSDLYKITDKLDSAAYRSSLVVKISKDNFGDQSGQYLLSLANYSDALINAGQYKLGLETMQLVMELNDKVKINSIEFRQKIYLVLAELNRLTGEYEISKKMLDKALSLDFRNTYSDFLLQAETSEQLAALYLQTNNFYRSEKLLTRALLLKKKNLPEGNPLFYSVNNAYASLKLNTGDIAGVEPYLKASTSIANEVYGSNSLIGIEVSKLYGTYYYAISDYKKAEEIYLEADKLIVAKLGKKHLKHAEILLELVTLRSKIPTYKSSDIEKLYDEAIDVVKSALGVNNPLYMDIIQRQAEFFISINKLKEAEKLIVEVEKYWKAKLGTDNKYIAGVYELRGDIAYIQSKYSDAETQFSKAKGILQSIYSENHPDYTNVYSKMAKVYYMNKNIDKAIEVMDDIIPKYLDFTVKYFPSMSFRQKSKYWNSIKDEFEFYNTLAFNSKKSSESMWGKAYNNTLATKAILLSSGVKLLNQVMSSEDTVLIGYYNDWVAKKEFLLTVLSVPKKQLEEQGVDLSKLESEIEGLEKQMSAHSTLFSKEDRNKKLPTWEDVREVLGSNENAIEIIRYRYFNKIFTDSVYYAALVVKKSSNSISMVLNNNGINMEKRNLKYYRNTTVTHIDDELSYDVYWSKIKATIPDGSVVYVSGDGVYNQINLEMLRHADGLYAIDENQFVFVSNTKDLLQMSSQNIVVTKKTKESKKMNSTEYLLCGSPDFYASNSTIDHKNVPDLPGTEKEVRLINDLLVSSGKSPMSIYKQYLTEDTLKNIKNPKILHVATHGYFAESTQSDDDNVASSPLLNSGLMLYSSGDILDNPNNKYVNQQDGILTAYEAMNLTLDNTELVVLSACETGRGEIQVGEGVAGLQRSFLLAGSKAIIVSLFKVNDDVTQKLMLSFYDKWLKYGDKRRAFSEAKKEVKAMYKEPVYWGAFMMIEGKPSRSVNGN